MNKYHNSQTSRQFLKNLFRRHQPSKRDLQIFNDATSISKNSASSGAVSVRKFTKMNPIYGYEFFQVRALAKDTVILRIPD